MASSSSTSSSTATTTSQTKVSAEVLALAATEAKLYTAALYELDETKLTDLCRKLYQIAHDRIPDDAKDERKVLYGALVANGLTSIARHYKTASSSLSEDETSDLGRDLVQAALDGYPCQCIGCGKAHSTSYTMLWVKSLRVGYTAMCCEPHRAMTEVLVFKVVMCIQAVIDGSEAAKVTDTQPAPSTAAAASAAAVRTLLAHLQKKTP